MTKLFISCGLTHVQLNEGVLLEFTPEDLERARRVTPDFRSSNMNDVMLDAIFRKMKEHGVLNCFDGYQFPDHGVFLFRPETGFNEEDGSAKYQIFQVQLFRSGGYDYAYIVLDELKPGTDLAGERIRPHTMYRLRGITVTTSVASPEHKWFNDRNSWYYWSNDSQSFNAGVCAL